jgi:serine/threonine protein kinase/tetratricopeptide (TPR) repeat protein
LSDHLGRLSAALANRYTVERVLGHGGMATVVLARDQKHDRTVALKILHPELAHAVGPDRFLREIRLAAQLSHPHILGLIDSGVADGALYYVMPYINGESLRERLQRQGPLPFTEAVRIAACVASALDYAHQQGVVHRDIKPENILLHQGEPLVADFGIARALQGTGDHLTETGLALGTPLYMSPEQALGEAVDGRADIYSLGCVLYETLTGQLPHGGDTPRAVLAHVLNKHPRPLHALRPNVPSWIEAVTEKALARAPEDRFATAALFERALTNPSSPTVAYRIRQVFSVGRRRVVAAVVIGALGVTAAALIDREAPRSPAPTSSHVPVLAVLPLDNVGEAEDEYFADGLTEELTTRLGSLSGLAVISKTSAAHYKGSKKNARQIGRELGADYLLEGSVRWEKGSSKRMRVTPRLIDVAADRNLWGTAYNAQMSGLFEIQADIAEQVATALDLRLLGAERQVLTAQATQNLQAYDFYLRGRAYEQRTPLEQDKRLATQMYERAVARDPSFALAHVGIAEMSVELYGFFMDRTPARLATAKAALDRALALAPDLPQAHVVLGRYYLVVDDLARAEEALTAAVRLRPNDAAALHRLGVLALRRGALQEAMERFVRASALDPLSNVRTLEVGHTYKVLRDYAQADRYYDQAIAAHSDDPVPYLSKAQLALIWRGDLAGAYAHIRTAWARVGAERAPQYFFHDSYDVPLIPPETLYQNSLDRLTLATFGTDTAHYYLSKAQLFEERRQQRRVIAYADSARIVLERTTRARPSDAEPHLLLGLANAWLGRKREAVTEGRQAVELRRQVSELHATYYAQELARIYAIAGLVKEAVTDLRRLLTVPSEISYARLRSDPVWRGLRGQPLFEQLLREGDSIAH